MNEIKQICECGHDFGNHGPISGACMLCACGSPRAPRISRRGFISMLGSGLLVAAAPEIIMPNRSGMDLTEHTIERMLAEHSGWFIKSREHIAFQWVDVRAFETVNGVVRFKATPIPASAIYGDSKGEDHGSSSKT